VSTTYLLDTNIISHMMRETAGLASQRFNTLARADNTLQLCTSVVVQCELEFGLVRRPNERLQRAYDRIVPLLDVLTLTSEISVHYAALRTQLESIGKPIGPNDALIAAHALAINATLVSADAEFLRVPGLRVENWLSTEKNAEISL
jgi:tRNA(fMet)-specific endonuclease VapC